MSKDWKHIRERGSPLLIRLICWITLHMGRPVGRFLLHPITMYFVLFNRTAVKASSNFLFRAMKKKVSFIDTYRHILTFATTILDRVYMLTDDFERLDIQLYGYESLISEYQKGQGCLLIGSHLGSFELLRALASRADGVKFKALMYELNAGKINTVLNTLNPTLSETIIPIGQPDTMLRVKEAIDNGEVIGILADRVADSDRKIAECNFFDKKIDFPTSPAIISGVLNVPVVVFFGVYIDKNHYKIHFEVLPENNRIENKNKKVVIQEFTQTYVNLLESYCRKYPYNWFNFYDYFKDEKKAR